MSNYRAKAARIREQKRNARILERLQNDFAAQLAIRDYRIAALEHQIHALVQTINCFRFPYPLPFSFFQNPLYFNFSNGQIRPFLRNPRPRTPVKTCMTLVMATAQKPCPHPPRQLLLPKRLRADPQEPHALHAPRRLLRHHLPHPSSGNGARSLHARVIRWQATPQSLPCCLPLPEPVTSLVALADAFTPPDAFEVEEVIQYDRRKRQYLLRYKGSDEPEWTAEQNCKGCADLLRAYWETEAKRLDNERSNMHKKTRYSSIPKEFRPTT